MAGLTRVIRAIDGTGFHRYGLGGNVVVAFNAVDRSDSKLDTNVITSHNDKMSSEIEAMGGMG